MPIVGHDARRHGGGAGAQREAEDARRHGGGAGCTCIGMRPPSHPPDHRDLFAISASSASQFTLFRSASQFGPCGSVCKYAHSPPTILAANGCTAEVQDAQLKAQHAQREA